MIRPLVLASLILFAGSSAAVAEKRCGWIVNPTPGNWWLKDRQDTWIIATQGGAQAIGMEKIPDLTTQEWTATGPGSSGYGCACVTMVSNKNTKMIKRITKVTQRPLSTCQADTKLKSPTG